jgi:hypothetical protein
MSCRAWYKTRSAAPPKEEIGLCFYVFAFRNLLFIIPVGTDGRSGDRGW